MVRLLIFGVFFNLIIPSIIVCGKPIPIPSYSSVTKQHKITLLEDYSYEIEIIQTTNVFDARGISHASYQLFIDQFTTLDHFEVQIINPINGKTLKKIKSKDLKERSVIDNGSIYQDIVLKYFTMEPSTFPVRVEMAVTIKKSGNFYFPIWHPQNYHNQSVETASLEINYPTALGIRHKSQLFEGDFNQKSDGETQMLSWTVANVPPTDRGTEESSLTTITLAPEKFSMDGFKADMDTWKDFGLWFYQLNQGRSELPESFRKEIQHMVKDAVNEKEKIQILYQYLQKNYRYVSIQLGLGGWRPMPSEEVLSKKYGDCKGLTLFMLAMLEEVGINAQYTLVRAGDDATFDQHFPSNQFNHAILRVSLGQEKYWLECTSSHLPAGFLGSFTKNRNVLVITPEGGEMDHTPAYSDPDFNRTKINASIVLREDGNAQIDGTISYHGFPAETITMKTFDKKEAEVYNVFNAQIGNNGLVINELLLDNTIQWQEISTLLQFSGIVLRYFRNTGKRVFLPLSWLNWNQDTGNSSGVYEEEVSIRKHRMLAIESIPDNINIQEKNYDLNVFIQIGEQDIVITKHVEIKKPASLTEEEEKELIKTIQQKLTGELIFTKL